MAKKVIELPFLRGQDEGVDPKLLNAVAPQGTLKRAVNVRLRKDGRLGTRRDYDALAMTAYSGTLVAFDLVNFDGRLCALGDTKGRGYPSDVYEFVSAGGPAWAGSDGDGDKRITAASALRDMGRLPATGTNCDHVDVAATNGIVCIVSSDGTQSFVHVFRADTGQRIMVERSTSLLMRPRVVAIGGVFYIAGITSAGTSITLRTFNPAVDTATQALSTPFGVAAAIVAWDMTTNTAGTEMVMGVARTGPTTQILRVDTAGTTQQTIAGPATLLDFLTVWNDGTRIHFIDVVDTTRIVRISTYAVAGGALQNGPTTMFSSGTTLQQVTLSQTNAASIRVVAQIDGTSPTTNIYYQDVTIATHALSAVGTTWRTSALTSKAFGILNAATGNLNPMLSGRFLDPDCTNFLATVPDDPMTAKDHYFSAEILGQLPHLARDSSSGKYYWANLTQDVDGNGTPLATEFFAQNGARLQTASIGGHLYIAAGELVVYDGREVVESGYQDVPVITSVTSSNGAGGLTPLGLYTVAVTWEKIDALGHLHCSSPSAVSQVTLGASDDTITVVTTTAHSIRKNSTNDEFGGSVKTVIWCTTANGTVLQRAAVASSGSTNILGGLVTVNITTTDLLLAEQEVLYTQGSRGALSGPLPFETALPSRYVWASKERLLLGGQPYAPQIQESRPLFPNEPIQWSLGLGFFATVRGDITAVAILDEQRYVFTREEIFNVPGEGIDDTGNGTLGPPVKLPSECGCIDWRSMVEIGAGLLFQGDTDKIYLLPRGGGAPAWIGQPVRDTLAAYPVITSATFCRADQTVCFTCNNTGGTDGRIIVFDTRAGAWYVDEPLSAETYRSSCAYGGVLVLAKGTGLVFRQQSTETPSTFIPVELETPDLYPAGNDGWAQIYGVSLLAEFRGNCTLSLDYSTDCGVTYTAGRTYQVSGLALGARVRKTWTFGSAFQAESIRLRFRTAALSGAATAGLIWNSYGVLVEGVEGLARIPAGDQG